MHVHNSMEAWRELASETTVGSQDILEGSKAADVLF